MATFSFEVFSTLTHITKVRVEAESYSQAVRVFADEADLANAEWEADWSSLASGAGVDSISREDDGEDVVGDLALNVLWSSDLNGFNPKDMADQAAEMDATIERLMLEKNTAPATSTSLAQRL